MSEYHSPSHSKWDCKYHLVFIPKKRKRVFFGEIRKVVSDSKLCQIKLDAMLPIGKHGGQTWNRTRDTRIFSPLLYQLSYLATV